MCITTIATITKLHSWCKFLENYIHFIVAIVNLFKYKSKRISLGQVQYLTKSNLENPTSMLQKRQSNQMEHQFSLYLALEN